MSRSWRRQSDFGRIRRRAARRTAANSRDTVIAMGPKSNGGGLGGGQAGAGATDLSRRLLRPGNLLSSMEGPAGN